MKKNFGLHKIGFVILSFASIYFFTAGNVLAQIRRTVEPPVADGGDDTWWYVTLFVLFLGLVGAVIWLLKQKKAEKETVVKQQDTRKRKDEWNTGSLDADREMEWLRKNQTLLDKKRKKSASKKTKLDSPKPIEASSINLNNQQAAPVDENVLPVFSITEIEPAKPFTPLPLSNDESLISAIEQAHDEYEEDEEVRDLAVRILTAFKMRNSVDALSQVALYDLSSSLRSKAVLTLTEFDHESVFEIILLACADPSREVRAAAARGLTRLSFDRADAWARIAETGETGRMRQAARAAIESGFVERSFDRLVHPDKQNAYEAFVLLALLVKAGETAPIFDTLKNHQNKTVQRAILHLLKVVEVESALNELFQLLEDKKLSPEIKAEINKAVEEIGLVTV